MEVVARIMTGLAAEAPDNKTMSIDATYLKAHRTASSLRLKRGAWASDWADKGWHEREVACRYGHDWATNSVFHDRRSGQRIHRSQGSGE